MSTLWQDLRYGLRLLWKAPGFTAVAVLTLALGVGANTAIFSVLHGVLLSPLDFAQSEQLVWFSEQQPGQDGAPFSTPEFLDFQAQSLAFEHIVGYRPLSFTLTGRGEPERVRGVVVTPNFLAMLRAEPTIGRGFVPDDGKAGAPRVVVLKHGYWQRRFGGDASIVGQSITLNEEPVAVIGVMPPSFVFDRGVDLWLNPKSVVPEVFPNFSADELTMRNIHFLNVLGRLKSGVTLAQGQSDMDRIVAQRQKDARNANHRVQVVSLQEFIVGDVRPSLLVLGVAVGFVLLIACANVANLLLARATARNREVAIRTALGASRGRIVAQLLTESLLLAIAGGALGLGLAYWGVDVLATATAGVLPRASNVRVDLTVLGFTLGVSLLAGLIFGMAPALEASRLGLNESLKEGGRSGTTGAQRHRLRGLLVVSEVALSLILLAGAGLLVRSMVSLLRVQPGFRPENLTTMRVSFSSSKYSQQGRSTQFLAELERRLQALPGVQGVALSNDLPLEGQDTNSNPRFEGRSGSEEERVVVGMHVVNPAYFQTMGIPLLKGRYFTEHDVENSARVIILNESAAKSFWPGEDPIGKRIGGLFVPNNTFGEVVGVVGDVKHNGLNAPPSLESYAPIAQNPWAYMGIIVRSTGDTAALVAAARREVLAIDPNQPVYGVRSFDQVMGETLAERRITLWMAGLFAALALVLAAVGIYGVMAYNVTQRTHEIGIRMALGAQHADILRHVVRQGMAYVLAGAIFGVAGALAVTRFLATLLFGVKPTDPFTFASVVVLLAAVAFAACYVPARRATRVDPLVALRYE